MYLDQHGDVRACCQNAAFPLGNVTDSSLLEIWRGDRARRLRATVGAGDLTLGCDFCRWPVDGGADVVFARTFDQLRAPEVDPPWPQQIEFSLTNACNLQCAMCNGDWSSSIRTHREGRPPLPTVYGEAFFEDLAAFLPHLEVAKFFGGEPFLGRESLRVLDMLADSEPPVRVQITTNGTQWSPRIERILDRLEVDVAISLDGVHRDTYEAIRVGASFAGVVANIDRFAARARSRGTGFSLSHCLMTTNWHQFDDFLAFAEERHAGVYVNTVTEPHDLSLYRLHPRDLGPIVDELRRRDASTRGALSGPRLAAWSQQLDRLRDHLDRLVGHRPTDYLGGTILGVPHRRPPGLRDHRAEARRLLEQLPGAEVGPVLVLDGAGAITAISSSPGPLLAGEELARFAGAPLADLLGALERRHGRGETRALGEDPDLQHWRTTFAGEDPVVLDAVIVPVADRDGVAAEVQIHVAVRTGEVAAGHRPDQGSPHAGGEER